jgi:hypothetical protein
MAVRAIRLGAGRAQRIRMPMGQPYRLPGMQMVYTLQHLHVHPDGEEDAKLIGVYGARATALEAVQRVRVMPGFRDFPAIVDSTTESDDRNGFYIDAHQLDVDSWSEGFITV